MNKEVDHANEKASSIAGEAIASVRMIIASSAESRMSEKYSGWIEESRKRGRKQDILQGVTYAPLFFAIYGVFALAFWFGFKLYLKGQVDGVRTIIM
jgi:ATP-binding cassette subfamily B (MDR/TAP) protein 1